MHKNFAKSSRFLLRDSPLRRSVHTPLQKTSVGRCGRKDPGRYWGVQGRISDAALSATGNRSHVGSRGGENFVANEGAEALMSLTVWACERQDGRGRQAGLSGECWVFGRKTLAPGGNA